MAADLGRKLDLEIETDSSAAKGIGLRRGVGKVRHLHTPLLWVQKRIQRGDFKVKKVAGVSNVADLGTKPLAWPDIERNLKVCGFEFLEGQSTLALKASL